MFLGLIEENGIKDSFRTGSNPQFSVWFVSAELTLSALGKAARFIHFTVEFASCMQQEKIQS